MTQNFADPTNLACWAPGVWAFKMQWNVLILLNNTNTSRHCLHFLDIANIALLPNVLVTGGLIENAENTLRNNEFPNFLLFCWWNPKNAKIFIVINKFSTAQFIQTSAQNLHLKHHRPLDSLRAFYRASYYSAQSVRTIFQ